MRGVSSAAWGPPSDCTWAPYNRFQHLSHSANIRADFTIFRNLNLKDNELARGKIRGGYNHMTNDYRLTKLIL